MGLTKPEDVAFPLRWGMMTAGRICADMSQVCAAAAALVAGRRRCGSDWLRRSTRGSQLNNSCAKQLCHAVVPSALPAELGRRHGPRSAGLLLRTPQAILIAISRGAGAVLGGVAARKLEDAEAFAAEHGCLKAYGGDSAYDDICNVRDRCCRPLFPSLRCGHHPQPPHRPLLGNPEVHVVGWGAGVQDPDIDICYVGTITALHMEHALKALKAGKHVRQCTAQPEPPPPLPPPPALLVDSCCV